MTSKTILIFGLPGSGKTTLANKIFQKLADSEHINADSVRQKYDDWDFSETGRVRQTKRMIELAKNSTSQWAIVDFVCPFEKQRSNANFDITIFMDTIKNSRFKDTDRIFEVPTDPDFHFTEFQSDAQSTQIVSKIQTFDWKKPTVQLLGRWQPWHEGHFQLFEKAISKTGQVAIQVRDTQGTDKKNPFDFDTVKKNILSRLSNEGYVLGKDYIIQLVPNITNISYGRDVGYSIEKIVLDAEIENISATKIRAEMIKNS